MTEDNTDSDENGEAEDESKEDDQKASETGESEGEETVAAALDDDGWAEALEIQPSMAQDLEAVYDIPVRVSTVLGKSTMQVNEILKLGRGAVVELDRKVGEAVDIYVNDRLVARGEVVMVDDRLGITMTEIIKTQKNNG